MICLEIYLNGKFICRAGGNEVKTIGASASCTSDNERIKFSVGGLHMPSEDSANTVSWVEDRELDVGDRLEVNVVEHEQPDLFEVRKSYGALEGGDGKKEYYCSFCGGSADEDCGMLIATHANICHNCLRDHSAKLL